MGVIDEMNAIIWAKIRERFMQNVRPVESGCWLWQGHHNGRYGTFHVLGASKTVYAHRMAYELFTEPILDGNVVMHTCDAPLCVNPKHLIQGTQQENMLDKTAKGRAFYPGMRRPLFGTDNPASKIAASTIALIRKGYAPGVTSYRDIAAQFSISKSQAFRIVKGHNWSLPYSKSQS